MTDRMRVLRAFALACVAVCGVADDHIWKRTLGGGNNNWSNTANWESPSGTPHQPQDRATFNDPTGMWFPIQNRSMSDGVGQLVFNYAGWTVYRDPAETLRCRSQLVYSHNAIIVRADGGAGEILIYPEIEFLFGSQNIQTESGATLVIGLAGSGAGGFIGSYGPTIHSLDPNLADTGTVRIDVASTCSGAFFLRQGTLRVRHSNALGTSGGTLNIGGDQWTTDAAIARLLIDASGVTVSKPLHVRTYANRNVNATLGGSHATGSSTFSGTVLIDLNTILNVVGTATTTFSSAISGNGGIAKYGGGTVVLGVANSYGGPTSIAQGTLRAGAAGSLSAGTTLWLADTADALLDLNGHAQSVASLSGGGAAGGNITLGAATLTVGEGDYGGTISGSGGLKKSGAGTLRLARGSSFGGVTEVESGRLTVAANGALGDTGNGTIVYDSAELFLVDGVNYSVAEPVELQSGILGLASGTAAFAGPVTTQGGQIDVRGTAHLTLSGAIGGTGGIWQFGGGTLTLGGSGSSTYSGDWTVADGTLLLAKSGGATAVPGLLRVGSGAAATARLAAPNPFGVNGSLAVHEESLFDLQAFPAAVAGLTMSGGAITARDPSGGAIGGGAIGSAGELTLRGSFGSSAATQTATLTGGDLSLGGAERTFDTAMGAAMPDVRLDMRVIDGALRKSGAGTLELLRDNPYADGTTVAGGTLRVSNAAGSATGSGPLLIQSGATLAGSGIVSGIVTVASGGWLAPGASAGVLTVGELDLAEYANLRMDLDEPGNPTANDRIDVLGDLTLDGTLHIVAGPSFGPGRYLLLTYADSLTDNGLAATGAPPQYDLRIDTDTPGEVALDVEWTPDHYVSPDGLNIPPYTNWVTAAHVIQDALDVARPVDTVWVAAGVYDTGGRPAPGMAQTNRVWVGHRIALRGVDGPENTVIVGAPDPGDPHGRGPAAVRGVWLDTEAVVSGFSITNGHSGAFGGGMPEESRGGGVYARPMSIISQCWITVSSAWEGGGVALQSAKLTHSRISENLANFGGGLYAESGSQGVNLLIVGNAARLDGGGLLVAGDLLLRQTTIADNVAALGLGGGIAVNGPLMLRNSIVYFNQARDGANIAALMLPPQIEFSCTWPFWSGIGNIDDDPAFLDRPGGDYRLRYASPCIDSGMVLPDVTDDLDGCPRPVDGNFDEIPVYDMGAFEYDPCLTDSDGDGMSDDWEHRHRLLPLDPSDAVGNPDTDAFTNLQEYIADTDPNDGGCYFRIVSFTNAPPGTVAFTSSVARVYTLLGCTNLSVDIWQPVPGAGPRPGVGGADAFADDNEPPKGPFYRLKVRLP